MAASITLTVCASSGTSFLRDLSRELRGELVPEMETTLRVAVLSAAGLSRPQIAERLGIEDVEVRMCLGRLRRITERRWG